MSSRKEAAELFGPRLSSPLDNPETRAQVARIEEELRIAEAQEAWRDLMAQLNFVYVIEPRRRQEAAKLGLTPEELAVEVRDPDQFRRVAGYAGEHDLSYYEAREAVINETARKLEPLEEAVELAHKVTNSRFGDSAIPKRKRKVVRRIWATPSRKKRGKTELADSPAWKEAVRRYAQMRESGELYPHEKLIITRGASEEEIAEALNVDQERIWDRQPELPGLGEFEREEG